MKAIAIIPGTTGSSTVDRPEPAITAQDEVKVKVIRVGICGADRTEVSGGRADAPDGQKELVIGQRDVWPGGGIGLVGNSRESGRLRRVYGQARMRGVPVLPDGARGHVPDRQRPRERHPRVGWLSKAIRS
jgi:hypothetical protein